MSVIEITRLHYAYPPLVPDGEPNRVLRGIDLSVAQGEFISLMGPTGAGKTTLCLALNGLVPQATGGVISGRVSVLGYDPRRTPVAQLAAHVGIVYQDPESQLFAATVEEEVAFGPENLGLAPAEIAERVDWVLDVVRMSFLRERSPIQLSGGQKQRVAIAASLAMLPEVLILDEPTANLDPAGQHEVLSVIGQLCRQRRMTIVMVSQDAEHVAEFSDRVAVLWEGRIQAVDEPRQMFADAELLRQVGLAAPAVSDLARQLHVAPDRFYLTVGEAEADLRCKLPADTPTQARPDLPIGASQQASTTEPLISVHDLVYHYEGAEDGEAPALNGVSLAVGANEWVGIIGQNGSGKTTLVKHLNGLLKPTGGDVWVAGANTRHSSVSALARRVGYVFQNPDHQIFCATTREEVAFGPRNLGLTGDELTRRTEETLEAFGLTAYAETPPAVLGYGLRRLVSLAAVFAMRPQVLILDEPTAGLDWRSASELLSRARELHVQGHTIVLVSHDMRLVAEYCPRVVVMHEGRVLLDGKARDVFAQADVLAKAQITPPQVQRLALGLRDMGLPSHLLTVDEFVAAWSRLASDRSTS